MNQAIPHNFSTSKALQYINSRGWQWKPSDATHVECEACPYCNKGGFGHFYVVCTGDNTDGLHICHRCGKQGNLKGLRIHLNDEIQGVSSPADWNRSGEKHIEALPNITILHEALLADAEALDYLQNQRGFSREIIQRQQLGLTTRRFAKQGEVRALVYPYFVNGNLIFVRYRTLPPKDKEFNSPSGHEAPLYNGQIIRDGLADIIFVEGEANVIAAMDNGIENIAGVPGANFKKAMWIQELDRINPDRIYILYDSDKVGQNAAQELASRIGIERCYKLVLPYFEFEVDGVMKKGKDLNEWFQHGGGDNALFEQLKQEAQLFDVQGVSNTEDALTELEDFFNGKESLAPTYDTPWSSLNKFVGLENGDVIDLVAPEKIGKTTIAMNMLEHAVNKFGEDGILICLEMTVLRLSKKWVSHVTDTPDYIPKTQEESVQLLQNFKQAVPLARSLAANRPGTLYFSYPQYKDVEDIYKLIRDCIRRYGVKWVAIDNLQRLCDTTPHKGKGNRTEHLSQISKVLSQIAKDFNIKMIRILQPHRVEQGKILTTNNVDGSSQIAKDCDAMITIHRNSLSNGMSEADFEQLGYVESEQSFDPTTLVTVGLSRYSGGGRVTLYFDGSTSTLKEMSLLEKANLKKDIPDSYETNNKAMGIIKPLEDLVGAVTI